MDSFRHARLVATLLLSLQAFAMARAAAPAPVACTCTHGPETPCACPLHAGHAVPAAAVDESKLPPCHRHKAHRATPASRDDQPCLRSGCGMPEPELALGLMVGLPEVAATATVPRPARHAAVSPAPPEAPPVRREKPPPRADV